MIDNNQVERYIIQKCRGRSPLPGFGECNAIVHPRKPHLQRTKQECRGRSPLPGFGVSPKNSFSLSAAVGGMKKIADYKSSPYA